MYVLGPMRGRFNTYTVNELSSDLIVSTQKFNGDKKKNFAPECSLKIIVYYLDCIYACAQVLYKKSVRNIMKSIFFCFTNYE